MRGVWDRTDDGAVLVELRRDRIGLERDGARVDVALPPALSPDASDDR